MNKGLLSVIVPVFNAELFLDRCVESISNQTYKNLEIILVDDGSLDNSPAICDKWAENDRRIVVVHKKNGGVGSARNAGLKKASGEFVQFVDSDDYLDPHYSENLMHLFGDDVDLVVGGFTIINDQQEKIVTTRESGDISYILNDIDTFLKFVKDGYFDMPVNKIFRKKLITKIFDENQPLGEDRIFNLNYFKNIKNKILMANESGYIYVFNTNSACHKKRKNLYDILIKPLNALKDFLLEKFGTFERETFFEFYLVALSIKNLNRKEFFELCKKLEYDEIFQSMVKNCKFSRFKNRMKVFLFKHKMYFTIKFLSVI